MNNKVLNIVYEYFDFAHFVFVYMNKQIYNDVFNPNFRTWVKIWLTPIYLLFCIGFNFIGLSCMIVSTIALILEFCLIPFSHIKFPKFVSNIRKLFYKN